MRLMKELFVKWLVELSLQKNFTPINIHVYNEHAFRLSCDYGHLKIAKWLINLSLQINFTPICFSMELF